MKNISRLVQLEFLKLKSNKALWWLLGLYLLAMIFISLSGGIILQYLANAGVRYRGFDPTLLPIYDFDDIWQNLAYLGYFFKIFPAFLIIISICNEFTFKTHRQNIIDGLSRWEFFSSKLAFAAFLSLLSGILVFVLGLILGFKNSDIKSMEVILAHIAFVPAHIIQLFIYFLAAMFLALLIRKSGITIILLLMYTLIIEPIAVALLNYYFEPVGSYLPLDSISSLVHIPFGRYILLETQTHIAAPDVLRAAVWCGILIYGIYYQLNKRDF